MGSFFVFIGFFSLIAGLVMLVISIIKKKPKKKAGIITGVGFLLFMIGGALLPPDDNSEKAAGEKNPVKESSKEVKSSNDKKDQETADQDKAKADEEKKLKEQLNFKGDMKTKASDGIINVEIDTNVPDGGVFEVLVMDGNLNMKSEFLEVKDGIISHDFEIPSEWEPAHFAASAMFRFNAEDHPQPDNIKEIYGEVGEKMTGDLTTENHLEGNNATINGGTVAYPSEEVVETAMDDKFNQAVSEMKELSNGIILDIKQKYDDWMIVDVVVSDSWYYSPDHEKERFVEQMGETVQNLVNNSGKKDGLISVYFVDSYGSELASPKMLGGWKIKK